MTHPVILVPRQTGKKKVPPSGAAACYLSYHRQLGNLFPLSILDHKHSYDVAALFERKYFAKYEVWGAQ